MNQVYFPQQSILDPQQRSRHCNSSDTSRASCKNAGSVRTFDNTAIWASATYVLHQARLVASLHWVAGVGATLVTNCPSGTGCKHIMNIPIAVIYPGRGSLRWAGRFLPMAATSLGHNAPTRPNIPIDVDGTPDLCEMLKRPICSSPWNKQADGCCNKPKHDCGTDWTSLASNCSTGMPTWVTGCDVGWSTWQDLGCALVLLYSCGRASDGQRAMSCILDADLATINPTDTEVKGFLELQALGNKAARSDKLKQSLLILVAPIFSLAGVDWFRSWVQAWEALGRVHAGLTRSGRFKHSNSWILTQPCS